MIKKLLHTTSLRANIIANFFGNAWNALISILFVPIYLKYIGAEGYGLIGIFASLQVVLSLLDSGLSTTLNKEIARMSVLNGIEQQMRNLVKTLGSIYWLVALTAGLIALSISPFLAKYWVQPKELDIQTITYAFILLSLTLMFQFPAGFYSGGLLGLQRQVMLNVVKVVFATVRSVGAVVILIFLSKSILVFFAWSLLVIMLQAFTLKYFVWYYLPKSPGKAVFEKQLLKNVWRFAAGMMGISLTAILLTQVDKVILSKMLPLEQFGYYTVACTLGLLILQAVAPLTQSYFPKFSTLISLGKTEELKSLYHQASQMISVLILPFTCILIFFSKTLILFWTKSPQTAESTWLIMSIYAYGTCMNGLINIPYTMTLSYGWTKLGVYQNMFFLVLLIPLTIFYAYNYGAVGGALSWATINTLYFLITPHLIHNRLLKGEVVKWYWNDNIKPMFASVAVVVAAKYFLPFEKMNTTIQIIVIMFTGLSAVGASLFFAEGLRPLVVKFYNNIRKNVLPGRK